MLFGMIEDVRWGNMEEGLYNRLHGIGDLNRDFVWDWRVDWGSRDVLNEEGRDANSQPS